MANKHSEIRFEEAIEEVLISEGGYLKGDPGAFDMNKALFPQDVVTFVSATQSKKWEALQQILGDRSEETLINDLCKELALKMALE